MRKVPRLVAAVVAGTAGLFGCSTAAMHPELVAEAAQVRVVRDPEAVRGCAFLQAISATQEPGYTTTGGLPLDAGTPAITMLQLRAQQAGGDTVEVTNSEKTYRAGGTRAQTLTTLTGNVYRCAQTVAQVPASTAAAKTDAPSPVATSSTGWQPWTDTNSEGKRVSGILVVAGDGRTNLSFACLEASRDGALSAAIAIGRPSKRNTGEPDASTVQLRFDGEPPASIPIFRVEGGTTLQFYRNDVSELANLMRMHDRLLARVWLEDGSTEVFDFDVRGFSQAARPVTASCASR
jgi:Domain of unknown function (DUF4156)